MNLKIPYYVKENFHTEHQGSMRRLEMSVEEDYLQNLRQACYREKNYSKLERERFCFIGHFNTSLCYIDFSRRNLVLESKKLW